MCGWEVVPSRGASTRGGNSLLLLPFHLTTSGEKDSGTSRASREHQPGVTGVSWILKAPDTAALRSVLEQVRRVSAPPAPGWGAWGPVSYSPYFMF